MADLTRGPVVLGVLQRRGDRWAVMEADTGREIAAGLSYSQASEVVYGLIRPDGVVGDPVALDIVQRELAAERRRRCAG